MNQSKFIWECWKEHIETHLTGIDKNTKKRVKKQAANVPQKKKEVLEQSIFACADGNLPFTIFKNPSMYELLRKLGKFRDETDEETYLLLLEELKSGKCNVDRLEKLSETFKLVSFIYFSRYSKIVY